VRGPRTGKISDPISSRFIPRLARAALKPREGKESKSGSRGLESIGGENFTALIYLGGGDSKKEEAKEGWGKTTAELVEGTVR